MRLTGKPLELTLNLIKRIKDDTEASVSIEVAMSLVYTIEALQQENEQLQEFANTKAEGRLVKRGKWIYEHKWKCSSCGWAQSHDFNTIPNDILKYCPNCGAKMSKEEAEKALEGSEWER
jgi:rubredoxin